MRNVHLSLIFVPLVKLGGWVTLLDLHDLAVLGYFALNRGIYHAPVDVVHARFAHNTGLLGLPLRCLSGIHLLLDTSHEEASVFVLHRVLLGSVVLPLAS